MTESDNTEGMDTTDESGDNKLIKDLRQQIKELSKRPDRETLEAEIYATLERRGAITEQLVALGHPAGMSAILEGTLGEGEVTRDSVAEALKGIGYQVEVEGATPESPDETPSQESELAQVQALSASVRSAASGGDLHDSISKKIAAAKTPAEIAAVMSEAGLTANYT